MNGKNYLEEKIKSLPTNTIVEKDTNRLIPNNNIYKKISSFKVPSTFDGIKIWDKFLSPVLNQGNCGSCWAFASVSSLADRFNIQSLGLLSIKLSPTKMILCSSVGTGVDEKISEQKEEIKNIHNFACFGNTLNAACNYLYIFGTNTLECIPYDNFGNVNEFQSLVNFKEFSKLPLCSEISGNNLDMCNNYITLGKKNEVIGNPARFYRTHRVYGIYGTDLYNDKGSEEQIRIEIYKWGPVCSAFEVYPDFYTFDATNDIYEWNGKGEKLGGHSIEIVGWGEEKGKQYWQIKNSWGTKWGINGYFKMARGNNNCKIEDNCIGMLPDFFYDTNYDKKQYVDIITINKNQKNFIDNERNLFINDPISYNGGVSPTTGYSRRVMRNFPWLDLNRPVPLNKLPNWTTFIAGNTTTNSQENIIPQQNQIENNLQYDNQFLYIFIIPFIITMVAITILLLFLFIRKK